MKRVGMVLVSYCGKNDTLECLESILNTKRDGINLDVVIVENASPSDKVTLDYSMKWLNKEGYEVTILKDSEEYTICIDSQTTITLIDSKENLGFGAGNNIGIKYLKNQQIDYLILLNNDTVVPIDFFQKILAFFSKTTTLMAMAPKSINYYNHDKIDSEGYGYFDINTGRSSHFKKYKINYLVGSCIIANNIDRIPLFDEAIFLYGEDVDYSIRLRNLGYDLSYDSSNLFYHKVSASTSKNTKMEFIKLKSLKYIVNKHGKLINRMLFYINRTVYYTIRRRYRYIIELWKAPLC